MPELRRPPARAAGGGARRRAARDPLGGVHARDPRRGRARGAAAPGLYNVYNALGAAALCLQLGAPLDAIVAGLEAVAPAFGRAETVDLGGRPTSILLVKNPAGANEVLRTLALEGSQLDLFGVLNDNTADGRDISWVWDADWELLAPSVRRMTCSGTRAAELALRLKYAGVDADRLRVVPALAGRARRRAGGRRRARCTRCRPTRRCWSCATCSRGAGRCRGTGDDGRSPRSSCGTTSSAAGTRPTSRSGASSPRGSAGRCSTSAPARGAWRSTLARPGHDVTALDLEPELLAALRDRAAGVTVATVAADAHGLRARPGASASSSCRCRRSSCCAERAGFLAAARRHLLPGGLLAIAITAALEDFGDLEDELPPPDVARVADWRFASQPTAVRALPGATRIERVRRAFAPDGSVTEEDDVIELAVRHRRGPGGRGPRCRLHARAGARRRGDRRARRVRGGAAACLSRTLRVLALYPDLMNIYADRGNLTVFERRTAWRGIGFELAGAGIGDEVDPDAHDLVYIGGGQDRDQALCARDLATVKRDALHAAAGRGAVIFAVCGGLQLLGDGYEMADERLPGVGLVDLDTRREDGPRLLGNIAIELDLPGGPARLAGFENHAGRTYLGRARRRSAACCAATATTGPTGPRASAAARTAPSIGTYMHGPLLPKNTAFADWLIATALGLDPGSLPPLDDGLEAAAHAEAARALRGCERRRGRRPALAYGGAPAPTAHHAPPTPARPPAPRSTPAPPARARPGPAPARPTAGGRPRQRRAGPPPRRRRRSAPTPRW